MRGETRASQAAKNSLPIPYNSGISGLSMLPDLEVTFLFSIPILLSHALNEIVYIPLPYLIEIPTLLMRRKVKRRAQGRPLVVHDEVRRDINVTHHVLSQHVDAVIEMRSD